MDIKENDTVVDFMKYYTKKRKKENKNIKEDILIFSENTFKNFMELSKKHGYEIDSDFFKTFELNFVKIMQEVVLYINNENISKPDEEIANIYVYGYEKNTDMEEKEDFDN